MCLLFVYINPNPGVGQFKVIVANNRDELYSRPTERAKEWTGKPKIIAGQDLMADREGGTWLGLAETGRIASLLNIFQPKNAFKDPDTVEGRGFIVVDYLRSNQTGEEYMKNLSRSEVDYNYFNLVILEPNTQDLESKITGKECTYKLLYFNNVDKQVVHCDSGVNAFGNSLINKPFKKVSMGKMKLENIIEEVGVSVRNEEKLLKSLFEMMNDTEQYFPDPVLSKQGDGHPEYFVQKLSSMCLSIPEAKYGTRTTSVVLIDSSDRAVFRERTMREPIDINNVQWEDSTHTMALVPPQGPQ